MPALNIIAIHEIVRNSGCSSSRPSGMLPNLPRASQMTKTTKALEVSTKSQPVFSIVHARPDAEASARLLVLVKPHTRKARLTTAVTPNTSLSRPDSRGTLESIALSRAGCGSSTGSGVGRSRGWSIPVAIRRPDQHSPRLANREYVVPLSMRGLSQSAGRLTSEP